MNKYKIKDIVEPGQSFFTNVNSDMWNDVDTARLDIDLVVKMNVLRTSSLTEAFITGDVVSPQLYLYIYEKYQNQMRNIYNALAKEYDVIITGTEDYTREIVRDSDNHSSEINRGIEKSDINTSQKTRDTLSMSGKETTSEKLSSSVSGNNTITHNVNDKMSKNTKNKTSYGKTSREDSEDVKKIQGHNSSGWAKSDLEQMNSNSKDSGSDTVYNTGYDNNKKTGTEKESSKGTESGNVTGEKSFVNRKDVKDVTGDLSSTDSKNIENKVLRDDKGSQSEIETYSRTSSSASKTSQELVDSEVKLRIMYNFYEIVMEFVIGEMCSKTIIKEDLYEC